MINQELIDQVKQRLVQTYNPLEIYIFGSYAWGCPDQESDLDVLVVLEKYDRNRHTMLVQGHKALVDLDISKDILLLDKQEFDNYSADHRRIYYKIKLKGKKIYARA